jgi:hypothetical protein
MLRDMGESVVVNLVVPVLRDHPRQPRPGLSKKYVLRRCSGRDVHSPKHHSMAGYRSSLHTKSYGRKFQMYTLAMSFVKTYLCTSTPAAGTDHRSCLGMISYEGVEIPTIWSTQELIRTVTDVSAMRYGWFFSIRFHFLPDPVLSEIIFRTLDVLPYYRLGREVLG